MGLQGRLVNLISRHAAPALVSDVVLPPVAPLLLLGLHGLGLLPAVDGVVDTDGADTDGEHVHGDGLVAGPLRLGIVHVAVAHGRLAGFVGLAALVDVVGGGDGRDGCETGVQELLVACFLLARGFVGGGEVWVLVDWVRDA